MPQAIVGAIGLTGAAAVAAEVIITIGINFLLSRVSRLFSGHKKQPPTDTSTQVETVTDAIGPRMIIYGSARVSGVSVFQ